MFDLMALGAGLGRFAQDYRQQQESALRQMAARLQMQQIERERQGRALMGQALMAGGIPGFGQQQPMSAPAPLPSAAPQAAPPAMPPPAAPSAAAPPPAAPSGPRTLTPEQQGALESSPAQMTPEQTDELYRAAGAGESRAGVPLTPPASDTSAAPAAPQTQAAPPGPQDQGAAPQADASQGVQSPGEFSQYLGMFHTADPQAIARRIKEIRPDADPESVAYAVESLYKMTSGNMREQLAAASMMKFLVGEQGRNQRFQQTLPLRQGQLDVSRQRVQQGAQREQRLSAQFQERTRQFNSRLQEARGNRDATAKRVALNTLLRDIDKSLYPGMGAQQPSDEERAALTQQRTEVVNELRQASGMKPLPATPAAPAPAQ